MGVEEKREGFGGMGTVEAKMVEGGVSEGSKVGLHGGPYCGQCLLQNRAIEVLTWPAVDICSCISPKVLICQWA